mmetsp:Transcript_3119/g.7417  ORF Transcript_3119/g.7417 Transcript_3119/m.7417 type:complete len:235 (+) Transcript_3119:601-1305(+)
MFETATRPSSLMTQRRNVSLSNLSQCTERLTMAHVRVSLRSSSECWSLLSVSAGNSTSCTTRASCKRAIARALRERVFIAPIATFRSRGKLESFAMTLRADSTPFCSAIMNAASSLLAAQFLSASVAVSRIRLPGPAPPGATGGEGRVIADVRASIRRSCRAISFAPSTLLAPQFPTVMHAYSRTASCPPSFRIARASASSVDGIAGMRKELRALLQASCASAWHAAKVPSSLP